MNNTFPLVSVIMNCHNGQEFLSDSLKSLISQTYKNWELIFWDNLSTDNSKKILNEFSDKRIKYFKSDKFTNLYEARNLALEKSLGNYVSFLDTDDLWRTDKLEKQVNFLRQNRQFKIVYSNYYVLENKKNKKYIRYNMPLPSGLITQKLLDNYILGISTVFLEKKIFEKFKFKKEYNIIGDFDFFINLSKELNIGSIPEPLVFYRIHEANLSTKKINIHIKELEEWIKLNKKELSGSNYSLKKQEFFLTKLKIKSFFKRFYKF